MGEWALQVLQIKTIVYAVDGRVVLEKTSLQVLSSGSAPLVFGSGDACSRRKFEANMKPR
jgi:hypothetical protein